MKRPESRVHRRARLSSTPILLVVVACLIAAGAVLWPGVASARTVARGLADSTIDSMTADQQAAALYEISHDLRGTYVRFTVYWAAAQPQQGAYDPGSAYMTGVASAVSLARQNGLRVMITFLGVPKWASDPTFWKQTGGYQQRDAMSTKYLPDFKRFCQDFATTFRGQVYAYEAWNEPNLAQSLFPQATPQNKNFAADLYFKMLGSFSTGIRLGDADALRVAGATAPLGSDHPGNISSTSPQRFAARIKAKGAASLFDAYSHHPYMPGASSRQWPEAAPRDPKTTVALQNLGTLLKLFPKKDFYLTEYGVQTAACLWFSGQHVDQITQASYLKRAYAYAARYPQVKLLMWFLLNDYSPKGSPNSGFYTGLNTAGGAHKRAWYAFARGNYLALSAPASIKRGSALTLTGKLSCSSVGALAGKPLVVQRHSPGHSWSTVKTVYSGVAGLYSVRLWPKASAYYRVTWLGVATSQTRHVAVK